MSDWLVTFIFGYEYIKAGSVLAIHIWTSIFVFLGVVNANFLIAEKLHRISFYMTVVCGITNVILNFVLIRAYGIIGAAYASLISQILGMLLNSF